tara:strand:- start:90 stop:464 length:375 start_codon:yes stop_codon:yes gene_type:complete
MNAKELNKNLFVIVLGLSILSFIFKIDGLPNKWLIAIASLIGTVGLSSKVAAQTIVAAWIKIGNALGWVNSRILLSIIFFILLTPIAWLYRMINKDPLKKKKSEHSTFVNRNHQFTKADLENVW